MQIIWSIKRYYLFIAASLYISIGVKCQSSHQAGVLPTINITKKLGNDFEANLKWESRHNIVESHPFQGPDYNYTYLLNDISILTSKKVGLNNKISGGYLLRITNNQSIHRIIQQFSMVRKFTSFKLAHRFAADQTFAKANNTFRLRYRIGAEFPLEGQVTDSGEFYLKLTHEYLNILRRNDYDLEIRLSPKLGYKINDDSKLEFGLDYRIDSFLDKETEQTYWINMSWFYRI